MLVENVRETIARHSMLDMSAPALVAVSGGPDSVCLLHVLHESGYTVEIVHLDHQTREGASAADAAFVREMGDRLGAPCHVESRPVAREAKQAKRSFEEYAREVRYEFFKRVAAARGYATVATGHHADDQVETVLMRLVRGTSPRGLAGIPPVNDLDGLKIVRPLLSVTRADILAFLAERQIPCRTDASNADPRHFRNRVRHQLLPMLEEQYNPAIRESLRRLAAMQREDGLLLEAMADAAFAKCAGGSRIDRAPFRELARPMQRRVMARAAWHCDIGFDFARVDAAVHFVCEGPTGNTLDLGAGVQLVNGRNSTEIVFPAAAVIPAKAGIQKLAPAPSEAQLNIPGTTRAFGKVFAANFISPPSAPLSQYCTPTRQVFDADAVGPPLRVRHPRTGDRFRPLGLSGSKTLGDYFTDIAMPMPQRQSRLVLVDDVARTARPCSERILWVIGHMPSDDAAVTDKTQRILEVTVTDET